MIAFVHSLVLTLTYSDELRHLLAFHIPPLVSRTGDIGVRRVRRTSCSASQPIEYQQYTNTFGTCLHHHKPSNGGLLIDRVMILIDWIVRSAGRTIQFNLTIVGFRRVMQHESHLACDLRWYRRPRHNAHNNQPTAKPLPSP